MAKDKPGERRPNGQFEKGHRQLGHRAKGKKNKYSTDIREALLSAGAELGGKDGLKGLFLDVGRRDPRVIATWISQLIPRELKVDGDGNPVRPVPHLTLNLIGVPSGTHLSRDEIEANAIAQLPMIEGEALDIEDDELPPEAA